VEREIPDDSMAEGESIDIDDENKESELILSENNDSKVFKSNNEVNESECIGKSETVLDRETIRLRYRKNRDRIADIATTDDSANYPPDCYSFISFHGPTEPLFWVGLVVFSFQMVFLVCALLSISNPKWRTGTVEDNPWDGTLPGLFATEVGPILRTTQFMSLITSVIFVDSSVNDIITAVHTFPNFSLAISSRDKVWCMTLSCVLRLSQGLFALLVSIILVFNSTNVIEVILNFTALNFISALDDLFFDFSKSGKYGPYLEEAANRIEEAKLPVCMFRKRKHVRALYTFVPLFGLILLFSCGVVYYQEHETRWETLVFRVQFGESENLHDFNGCYLNDLDRDDGPWKRDFYIHDGNNTKNAEFGFCIEDKRWVLYEGTEPEPCRVEEEDIVVFSSKIDSFDIENLFFQDWFTLRGTPVDLYFFEEIQDGNKLFCDEFMNDGVCNDHFNEEAFGYDGGDCCASTCSQAGCGLDELATPFETMNKIGDGYPSCKDTSMVPIIIELNAFTNNRVLYNTTEPLSSRDRTYIGTFRPDFWTVEPTDALLTVSCNDVKILKAYINPSMINKTETLMVPEEANCEIRIKNSTSTVTHFDDDPIWYVNYTVYNGENDDQSPTVILVKESSYNCQSVLFERMPDCYLKPYSQSYWDDTYNLYNPVGDPQSSALLWMKEVTETRNGVCPDDFTERFALAVLHFAAPSRSYWIQETSPCNWPHIICVGSYNSTGLNSTANLDLLNLHLADVGLSGRIPNEIGLLANLALYDVSDNPELTGGIPSEIGNLTSLATLKFENNTLSGPLPTELGFLTSLKRLHLTSNDWTGTIPSEIGLLTNLGSLRILNVTKMCGSIPTEIGFLTSLTSLRIGNSPGLTGTIPSEIQYLTQLKLFSFKSNSLTGSIPSEVGSLTKLTRLRVDDNDLTGRIPSEIGLVTRLTSLNIDKTFLTGSLPIRLDNFHDLRVVYMDDIDAISKDSVPDTLGPKIAEDCNICDGLGFHEDSTEKCVRIIDEWESHGKRTASDECDFIRSHCVICHDEHKVTNTTNIDLADDEDIEELDPLLNSITPP